MHSVKAVTHTFLLGVITILYSYQLKAQCFDVVVSPDGTGDFISVQDAIESAPTDLTSPFVIFIKDGIYEEKLFIEKNFITLIGESRDSTILTTAVLRREWRETNPDDWGAATINIASNATDLTLAHLTVRNNFADVFPEFPDNNDHTFAVRGGGHRIIIIDCNITATGGDTLSLWNTNGGMFYHNNCYFEGWVDYLAPRGYCYIADSEFFGHNSNASIWHDGSGGEDHKFVIRNSVFDGVPGFALGRFHKDAAFYLMECDFTSNMKNMEIYHTGSDALIWGERVYYWDCHGPFVDWTWFKDNINQAMGSPEPGEIDAQWTFNGEWDPESLIDGLLPHAFVPYPANGSGCVSIDSSLSWVPGRCVIEHRIFFGDSENVQFAGATTEPLYSPQDLEAGMTYFWRVDEVTVDDTLQGPLWHFTTTLTGGLGSKVNNPDPANGSDYFTNVTRLDWSYQTCNSDSFYVYYGRSPGELEFLGALKYPPFFRSLSLDNADSTYFWRIDSKNDLGVTEGDVWSFILNPSTSAVSDPERKFVILPPQPNPFKSGTSVTIRLRQPSKVSYSVYNANGKIVDSLSKKPLPEGEHTLPIMDKGEYPAGVYVLELVIDNVRDSMMIMHQD